MYNNLKNYKFNIENVNLIIVGQVIKIPVKQQILLCLQVRGTATKKDAEQASTNFKFKWFRGLSYNSNYNLTVRHGFLYSLK